MSMSTGMTKKSQDLLLLLLHNANLSMDDWQSLRDSRSSTSGSGSSELAAVPLQNSSWCGATVEALYHSYRPLHCYLALTLCVLGSLSNAINIMVLMRREMVSPTNVILAGLAVTDLIVMLEYIPFIAVHYLIPVEQRFSHAAASYILFHAHFAQIFHMVSVWLTVVLAVWRYRIVLQPTVALSTCNMRRSVALIVIGFCIAPLLCIPSMFVFTIHKWAPAGYPADAVVARAANTSAPLFNGTSATVAQHRYRIDISSAARWHNSALLRSNFWLYSVLIKLAPSIILVYITYHLVTVLWRTKQRLRRLHGNEATGVASLNTDHSTSRHANQQADRTTVMLVLILVLFLLTEVPQGVVALATAVFTDLLHTCYLHLGDILDMLALLNCSVNFPLYCLMSKQFRTTFRQVVCRRGCDQTQLNGDRHLSLYTGHVTTSKLLASTCV